MRVLRRIRYRGSVITVLALEVQGVGMTTSYGFDIDGEGDADIGFATEYYATVAAWEVVNERLESVTLKREE